MHMQFALVRDGKLCRENDVPKITRHRSERPEPTTEGTWLPVMNLLDPFADEPTFAIYEHAVLCFMPPELLRGDNVRTH